MSFLFMIKEHPTEDRVMVQVDNEKIELNSENQKKLYKYLKRKLRE